MRVLFILFLLSLPGLLSAREDLTWTGVCDASAAVPVGAGFFLVANDEDNLLRLYPSSASGPASASYDLRDLFPHSFGKGESDLEAAASAPDRTYWISSHGANKTGKARPDRRRLFATRVTSTNDVVSVCAVGTPYAGLVEDLVAHPALRHINWAKAAATPPKAEGGMNIEALASAPCGALWLGFRNPVPAGKALLVPVLNPAEILDKPGIAARLGEPVALDLGGLGLRDMTWTPDGQTLLLLAGPVDDEAPFAIFRWTGKSADAPVRWTEAPLRDLHPEALVFPDPTDDRLLLISDDGGRNIGGVDCKECPPAQRAFRGRWTALPAP